MRILIFNWRDVRHPLSGGAEISTHEHAKGLVKAGYDVFQFSSGFKNGKSSEVIDGVKIIRRGNHYTVHVYAIIYYLFNFRGKIDLIIDEFHFIPFFTPIYARKTRKIAFIHEVARETWFKNIFFPLNIIGYLIEPLFFKIYKKTSFMTVSSSTKKDLEDFGISPKNITVVHNGTNVLSSSAVKEKNPTIIYLGKLAIDKGTEDAIYAFKKISEKFKEAKLWIVGKEERRGYGNKVNKIVDNLKLSKKVTFFGYVPEKNKFDLLKKAWILLHPSIKEGWGLTVIEAASCGTPTVGYVIQGLKDSVQNNKTGLLVSPKKPISLAEAIIRLINDKKQLKDLSKNSIAWSSKFAWEEATEKSLKLVKNLI